MIGIVVYEQFAAYEVILASYLINTRKKVLTIGVDSNPVRSMGGMLFLPDTTFAKTPTNFFEAIIIPGGKIGKSVLESSRFLALSLYNEGKIIAAICSGVSVLYGTKILEEREFSANFTTEKLNKQEKRNFKGDKGLVVDKNVVTAAPEKYIDFSLEVAKVLEIYQDERDYEETVNFFKNQRR